MENILKLTLPKAMNSQNRGKSFRRKFLIGICIGCWIKLNEIVSTIFELKYCTFIRDHEIISAMKSKYHHRKYRDMLIQRKKLPAWNCCDRILDELQYNQVLVVVGDTGCGKTTQVGW